MKKQIIYLGAVVLLLSSCSAKTYQALQWKEEPVNIDGSRQDWGEFLRYYDKDSKLFYEIGNDRENLYLAVATQDESSKQKILQNGLTFGIDLQAHKDYPLAMTFPYADSMKAKKRGKPGSEDSDDEENQGTSKPERMDFADGEQPPAFPGKQPFDGQMKRQLFVKGFDTAEEDSILETQNMYGIDASLQMIDSTLFVEASIPLRTFYKEQITYADTINPVNFQILLSALERPKSLGGASSSGGGGRPEMGGMGSSGGFGGGQPMGGMPPGGGGGPGMGGPGGSGGRPSGDRPDNMPEKQSLDYSKKEIKLMMRFSLKE